MSDARQTAPIVAGIGLRLPGARGLAAAWSVLAEGRCTVTTVSGRGFDPAFYHDPAPGRRGKTYTLAAGQLEDLYHFDAAFFGISPREAAEMDPQQRHMLVATWEAVEDAGLDMADLAGPRTGVFVGSSIVENLSPYYYDTARGGSTFTLGNTLAVIANRISATFDFGGPSQVIDTACSAGLTALDTAAQALRRGDLDVAIVGGVHVVRAPGGFVGFSQARMLSPTGRCRAFDAGADGYVRSEAAIALVLMRPEVAQRLQARQRGRVLASGVNTDGGASPLLVPSGVRQQTLIASVLESAGRAPEDLSFYEAHGTGTQVGDPVEAQSIGRALASLRRERLLIGSSKTNFGHTEPASGLVGLVKALLAMEHRALPASLHFDTPNPGIDFDGLKLRVATALTPLPEGPLLAGVNAFGFGGTNAVVLVEGGAPTPDRTRVAPVASQPWLLVSAASPASLGQLAGRWSEALSNAPDARDTLIAAASRRTLLPHRVAVPGDASLIARLDEIALGETGTIAGRAAFERSRTVLAFPGNGAQIAGMGQESHRSDARFRQVFDQIAEAFAMQGIGGLTDMLFAPDLDARLASPLVAQPLLVACQVAQARSLMAAGLRPDAVIGHSVGELSALAVAGALDVPGLARVVASRSRRFETLRGAGGMAALALSEEEATRVLAGLGEPLLAIAAVNAPRSVTVSGPTEALERLAKVSVSGRRIAMVPLAVEVPYHSPALDPLRDEFYDVAGVAFRAPTCRVAGAALGRVLEQGDLTADYLWRNARETVRFSEALSALCADGPALVVEIAPRRVLAGNIRDLARQDGQPLAYGAATPVEGVETPEATVARLWTEGAAVDRAALSGRLEGPAPDMPSYPWQELEHATQLSPDGYDAWGEAGQRHFAGRRPDRDLPVWTAEVTPSAPSWLADHRIGEAQVLPAAALVELVLSAMREQWPGRALSVTGFDLLRPAEVAGDGLRLRTTLMDGGRVAIDMRPRLIDTDWTGVARGTVQADGPDAPAPRAAPTGEGRDAEGLYDGLAEQGLRYGPAFRRLARIWSDDQGHLCGALRGEAPAGRFVLDPTALDAAFHLLAPFAQDVAGSPDAPAALAGALSEGAALLPTRIGRLTVWPEAGQAAFVRLLPGRLRQRSIEASFVVETAEGRSLAMLEAVEFTLARLNALPIEPARWRRRMVRLRPPGQAVAGPKGWRKPQAALVKLGFTARPAGPEIDLSDPARVLRQHPDRAGDLQVAMMEARGELSHEMSRHAAATRAAWQTADRILRDLLRRWPEEERCAVLLVGSPPGWLVTQLAAEDRIDTLHVSHPDEIARASLRRLLPPMSAPLVVDSPEAGAFDVVLSAFPDTSAPMGTLAPGGLALSLGGAMGPEGDVLFDTTGALCVPVAAARAPVSDRADSLVDAPQGPEELHGLTIGDRHLRLIVRLHRVGDDPLVALVDMLAELRRATADGEDHRPLRLVAIEEGASEGFEQLTAGLGAAVMTLRNERPETAAALIAVSAEGVPDWEALFALADCEPWITCTRQGLRGLRIVPLADRPETAPALGLSQRQDGRGTALLWTPRERRRPRAREVEIAVAATGLNFRDVMRARGLLPERFTKEGASGGGLGMELAGVVLRAGRDAGVEKGAAVMGFAADAFASHVTLPSSAVVPVPEGMDLAQAAALPVAYVTAWEALRTVGRVSASDIVLVHGGAGGLGLAAIRVARLFGARVFATASTAERRALAVAAGAEACFDSRSPGFTDALRAATGGQGADIVLNSLAGEAMLASIDALAPFGRFIELGKRGFLENAILPLGRLAGDAAYHAFDLDRRLAARPGQVARTMEKVRAALADGRLPPLPVTPFKAEDVTEAFGHLFAARQIGKIVVTPPRVSGQAAPAKKPVRDDWVILGGTGGVGLALARMLRENGAARVHLLSRSGEMPLGSGAAGAWVAADPGTMLHAVDAADPAALSAVFDGIAAQGRRIGGVIHAAMVLRDRMIRDLDPVETALVLHAKLGVARSLDAVLRARAEEPDSVLFLSSIAAALGNPGQVAYAAANAAMEALAEARRAAGRPASVLSLGPIGDGGVLTRNAALSAQLGRLDGLALLPMRRAMAEILTVLRAPSDVDHVFAPMNWGALAPHLPALGLASFSWIVPEGAAEARPTGDLARRLAGLDWAEAVELIEQELADILCGILRLPPTDYDPQRPLGRYGIDSLMAMELRLDVERRLGLPLVSFALSEETTPARFAVALLSRLKAQEEADG